MKSIAFVSHRRAFTLVELLVSVALLSVLMLVLVSITNATQQTWSYTTSRVEQFREARSAFESMTRRISQATLNTYWDYDNEAAPTKYLRQSELRFISGNAEQLTNGAPGSTARPTHAIFFQAPLGFVDPDQNSGASRDLMLLPQLLNTWGFYVEFGDDANSRPPFVNTPKKYRFRLTEMMEPSETLSLYKYTSGLDPSGQPKNLTYTSRSWIIDPLSATTVSKRPIADNIMALVLLPKLTPSDQKQGNYADGALAPEYFYSSTGKDTNGGTLTTVGDPNLNPINQLPPVVQVTMVAVDETSYKRYQRDQNQPDLTSKLFKTVGSTLDKTKDGYAKDLDTLQQTLTANKLTSRIFSTNVSIKAAKWSRSQTK